MCDSANHTELCRAAVWHFADASKVIFKSRNGLFAAQFNQLLEAGTIYAVKIEKF